MSEGLEKKGLQRGLQKVLLAAGLAVGGASGAKGQEAITPPMNHTQGVTKEEMEQKKRLIFDKNPVGGTPQSFEKNKTALGSLSDKPPVTIEDLMEKTERGAEAQEERQRSESPGANVEKRPELPAYLEVARIFANNFLKMFAQFDKHLTLNELPPTVTSAINSYLNAFAVARDVNPQTRPPALDPIALELALRKVNARGDADKRAVAILNNWLLERRLRAAESDPFNQPTIFENPDKSQSNSA